MASSRKPLLGGIARRGLFALAVSCAAVFALLLLGTSLLMKLGTGVSPRLALLVDHADKLNLDERLSKLMVDWPRPCAPRPAHRNTWITAADPTVACIYGAIDKQLAEQFLALSLTPESIIIVNSVGGDVESALNIADQIVKLHAIVLVDGLCISSCANYLFVAGAEKALLDGSYLGFHGGPSLDAEIFYNGPSDQREARLRSARSYFQTIIDRQTRFYRNLGVNDRLIYHFDGITRSEFGDPEHAFWMYDEANLRLNFGVKGVHPFLGPDQVSWFAKLRRGIPLGLSCRAIRDGAWVCKM